MRIFIVILSSLLITTVFGQLVQGQGQGLYQVIGPRTIRPNSEYHVAINIQKTSGPTLVTASIQSESPTLSNRGSFLLEKCQDLVQPYSTAICRLKVGDIKNGNYTLQVIGTGSLEFHSDFLLEYFEKSYSVFIQTDRAVYEPGSTIQFRAIILNPSLKPAAEVRNESLFIYITDGKGNRVKYWRDVEATKGVFSGDLKLSSSPILGDWNISVVIHGQTYTKSIEVAEYIFPKFVVDIQAPKHVTFKDNILTVNVETRYNYGKKVNGEATVTVYPTISSGVIQPIFQNPIRKIIKINGSATIDFDIDKDLGLNDEYERTVIIDVTVEESFTGRRQNNSVETHIHKYNYKMELIKTADYFKPGLKYTAYVKIARHDNSPLKIDQREVIIRHGYTRIDEIYETNTFTLDDTGILKLEYVTPTNVNNFTALRIQAEYQDLKERIPPIPAAVSYSNSFLQISVETSKPMVNADIDILVNSTEPLKHITYVLLAKGDVILTRAIPVENKKMFKFHFTAVNAMVPLSHLIVYHVKDDGELVGDVIDIQVNGLFDNFIDIDMNTNDTDPDLDVELFIRAQQNSYIGLMAVDENVNKLRSGFDLTSNDIFHDLLMYDSANPSPYSLITKNDNTHFTWKPGASNLHAGIYDAGADLLTNAHLDRHKPTLQDVYLRPVFYGSSTVKPDLGVGLPFRSVTRPPLAGPYAFSRIPKPVWNKPKVYLTEKVAQTWLFSNFSSGYESKTSLRRKVPSTQTNWLISGFSLDPIRGLALMPAPKILKVSKTFEISIDLPYSVQRGEILAVPVVVLNNNNQDVPVDITFHNTEQHFEFSEVSNKINKNFTKKVELYKRKKVYVPKTSGSTVFFMIMPRKEGIIDIRVTANSPRNQDTAIGRLRVEVEGETEFYAKSVLIDLRQAGTIKKHINFSVPINAVRGSNKVEVAAVGNLLGVTMAHLEELIRLPTGCGEQNLVHFMSSTTILQYLRNTRQLNPTIQNEAVAFLETLYQRQLSYKRKDGSFSPFGERDDDSNLWLTAYVAMAFRQAKSFIYIDDSLILTALNWLADHQNENGSFVETGNIVYENVQNRNGNSLALTCFTVTAFLENQISYSNFTNVIYKSLDYITSNMNEAESTYTISICNYVLHVVKHASRQTTFNLLESRAIEQDQMKFWSEDNYATNSKNPWKMLPRSIDIEVTSYAVLSYIEANLIDDATPVLNWLVNQQNNLGGFTSSRDTVVGLQALFKMVSRLSGPTDLKIDYVYNKGKTGKFNIHTENAIILQSTEVDSKTREINVTAHGTGIGLFKVLYQYNMNVTGPWPLFTLDPQVDKNSNVDHLQLSICVAFVSKNLSHTPFSNMAVMEVTLPSGFTADKDSLPSLEVSQNVQKVETSHGDTKVILYFNNLTVNEYCPTVSAFRTHKVAKQMPVPVVLYDYYDTARRARVFYWGPRSTICDICEMEDCGDICAGTLERQRSAESNSDSNKGDDGSSSSREQATNWLALVLILGILSLIQ